MDRPSAAGADGLRWFGALAVVVGATSLVVVPTPAAAQVGTGSVSGTVVNTDRDPLEGICVNVSGGPGSATDANGDYVVQGIEPGDHTVQFSDCNPPVIYAASWYLDHTTQDQADTVPVLTDTDTPLDDVTLALAATVKGTVTDAAGTTGLADICVDANTPAPNGGWSGVGGTRTGPVGTYTLSGQPPLPDVRIQFHDCATPPSHVDQWYDGAADFNTATPLNLTPGEALPDIDAHLATGVVVTGKVSGDSGPLAGINVYVNRYDGPGPSTGAVTKPDGTYRTGALPDGDYRVQFDDPTDMFASQYWYGDAGWHDADRLALDIGDGPEHGGINATLAQAATITGTVTGGVNTPLADICVNANTPAPNGGWSGVGQARTGTSGTYTLTGLPPSVELRIQFQDCAATPSHVEQWWNAKPDFNAATPVNLTPGGTKSDVNADLVSGVAVSGTVTDGAGTGLAGINVYVSTYEGSGLSTGAQTAADGTYRTRALPDGDYRVQFDDPNDTYATQYWDGQPTWNTANRLTLEVATRSERGIDAQLAAAASISGRVTGTNGPVGGACIDVATDTPIGPDGVGGTQADTNGYYNVFPGGSGPRPRAGLRWCRSLFVAVVAQRHHIRRGDGDPAGRRSAADGGRLRPPAGRDDQRHRPQ